MADLQSIVEDMAAGREIRFSDLFKVCEAFFGAPRNKGTSHYIFRTPWPGDPRVNIQNDRGRAKPYQVRQVLAAIAKMKQKQEEDSKKQDEGELPKKKPPKKK